MIVAELDIQEFENGIGITGLAGARRDHKFESAQFFEGDDDGRVEFGDYSQGL
jgi:hypothetical protein